MLPTFDKDAGLMQGNVALLFMDGCGSGPIKR